MDKDTAVALAFMIFGLGFFLFVVYIILHSNREGWERRVMEAREFGFGGKNQHTIRSLHDK